MNALNTTGPSLEPGALTKLPSNPASLGHAEKTLPKIGKSSIEKPVPNHCFWSQCHRVGVTCQWLEQGLSLWGWRCWHIPHGPASQFVPEMGQKVPDCSHLSPQALRAASQESDLCFVQQLEWDELGSFGLWVFLFKKHSKTQC